jgi:hypothetical protein
VSVSRKFPEYVILVDPATLLPYKATGGGGGGGTASSVNLLDNLGNDITAANPLPVSVIGTVAVGSLPAVTVSSLPALPAGANTIGKVDQGAGGASAWLVTGAGGTFPVTGTVAVSSLPALPTGGNVIGAVTQSGAWTVGVSGSVTVTGTVTANAGSGTFTVSQTNLATADYDTTGATVTQAMMGLCVPSATGPVAVPGDGALGLKVQVTGGALSAVQSGTWTVQQGTPPWSVSQSGTWNVGLSAGSNTVGKVDQGVGGVSAWKVDGTGGSFPVTDSGGSLTVDGTIAATQSGAWTVTQSGTWNVGLSTGSNVVGAVTQSGTWTVQQGTPPWATHGAVGSTVSLTSVNPFVIGVNTGGAARFVTSPPSGRNTDGSTLLSAGMLAYDGALYRDLLVDSSQNLKVTSPDVTASGTTLNNGDFVIFDVNGCGGGSLQLVTSGAANFSLEGTVDGSDWVPLYTVESRLTDPTLGTISSATSPGTLNFFGTTGLKQIKVTQTLTFGGTTTIYFRAGANSHPVRLTAPPPATTPPKSLSTSGTISAPSGSVTLFVPNARPNGLFILTGTWSGAVQVQVNGVVVPFFDVLSTNGLGIVTSTAANGTYRLNSGTGDITVTGNLVSGTVNVTIQAYADCAFNYSYIMSGSGRDDLGKTANLAYVSASRGLMPLAVQKNTRAAISSGGDGSFTPLQTNALGDLRVDASAVAIPVTDNGGTLTVDGTVAVTDGGGSLTVDGTLTVTDGGGSVTVDGGVDVLSVLPGTGATNLGKAEDAPHASGDTGVMMLAVQRSAGGVLTSDEGDYGPLLLGPRGGLQVEVRDDRSRRLLEAILIELRLGRGIRP